jgi:hypothetical protein
MDAATYWKLKAGFMQAIVIEEQARAHGVEAQRLNGESNKLRMTAMQEAGLDPEKKYKFDDRTCEVVLFEPEGQGRANIVPTPVGGTVVPSLPAPSNPRANDPAPGVKLPQRVGPRRG